jgi:hypothetical protein
MSHTYPETPKFIPKNLVYTDGSDIKGQPRLKAAVVHTTTRTTIYIYRCGGSRGNSYHNVSGIGRHSHGAHHIRIARVDRNIYIFSSYLKPYGIIVSIQVHVPRCITTITCFS